MGVRRGVCCRDVTTHTDARLTSLILAIVRFKIKGQDVQAGSVQWERQLLAPERDHNEVLTTKIRRALLMNILPVPIQNRVLEHLDRLKTYVEVRDKFVALVQCVCTRFATFSKRCLQMCQDFGLEPRRRMLAG